MDKVTAAFIKAQAAMAPALKKANNPHFKSKFADLEEVASVVKEAIAPFGLGFIQKFHPSDSGIALETIILHESGEQLSNGVLNIPATKNDAVGFASACSYARRYSLQTAFGLVPQLEDDDGNAASGHTKGQGGGKPVLVEGTAAFTRAVEIYRAEESLEKVRAKMEVSQDVALKIFEAAKEAK